MNKTLINLKKRITKNKTTLQEQNILVKPMIKMINILIEEKTTEYKIKEWFKKYDNVIFRIEKNLEAIEKKIYSK